MSATPTGIWWSSGTTNRRDVAAYETPYAWDRIARIGSPDGSTPSTTLPGSKIRASQSPRRSSTSDVSSRCPALIVGRSAGQAAVGSSSGSSASAS